MAPAAASATATSPWGTAGGKTSLVETSIASLGRPCTSTDCPESCQGRYPFERVAVPLVEEGGGIDRMARVDAVLAVDRERLRGRRVRPERAETWASPRALGRSVAAARCGRTPDRPGSETGVQLSRTPSGRIWPVSPVTAGWSSARQRCKRRSTGRRIYPHGFARATS